MSLGLGTWFPSLPLGHARHCDLHVCRGIGERAGRVLGRALARAVSARPVRTSVERAAVCELRGCLLELGTQDLVFLPFGHARYCELHTSQGDGERAGRVSGRAPARAVSARPVCTSVEGAAVCELRGYLLELGAQSPVSLPPAHARHFELHVCWGYGERAGRVCGLALARAVSVRPVLTSVGVSCCV